MGGGAPIKTDQTTVIKLSRKLVPNAFFVEDRIMINDRIRLHAIEGFSLPQMGGGEQVASTSATSALSSGGSELRRSQLCPASTGGRET